MDNRKFDTITRALAANGSRRRVLGVLAGGIAALAGAATLEAKRGGNGKSRGRGRGKGDDGDDGGNGGNGRGRGRGREKVFVCHRNGKDEFKLIRVGAPAAPAHERHGDVVCEELACQTVTGCGVDEVSGDPECTYEADAGAEGDQCVTEDGEDGICDDAGVCVGGEPGEEG